jgi:soluble lytic murein transglycosylase-like protein
MVLIQDVPGAVERAPILSPAQAVIMDRVESTWGGMCRIYAEAYGLPDGWLQAMIFRESGGDPNARNPEGTKGPEDDGIGLLQITHPSLKGRRRVTIDGHVKWVGGLSDAELLVPATNIGIGAKYAREQMLRYGNDFPRVAAAFNAGSAHPAADPEHDNPWSLHSTGNHITIEVSALNYWISKYKNLGHVEPAPLIDLMAMAREADDMARRDTEPPPKDSA